MSNNKRCTTPSERCSKRMKRWWWVILYTIVLLASLPWIRYVWDIAGNALGPVREYLVVSLYIAVAGFLLYYRKILLLGLVLLVTVAVFRLVPLPIERIHFIQYGILGWMVWWAVESGAGKRRLAITLIYIIAISILDEVIQGILPNRYYDIRDIWMNIIGGSLGLVLRIRLSRSSCRTT